MTLSTRTAENNVDFQKRITEFAVDDLVVPYGHGKDMAGRVTAVFPAIGMVDVEFPAGNKRYPVEDLQRSDPDDPDFEPPMTNSTPGGQPTVSVPGGPHPQRVARAFVEKQALYWREKDRRYQATQEEMESGHYKCPKCKAQGIESLLRPAVYKRREGQSEKLLGCPECLWLVKKADVVNDPDNAAEEVA